MCNLIKERDKALEIQSCHVLKGQRDPTIEYEDKKLYYGVESQIKKSN